MNSKLRSQVLKIALLLAPAALPEALAQEKVSEYSIVEFERENSIDDNKTSHKATVTLIDDVPEGGGRFAAKTVVDSDAGTTKFFVTGFRVPSTDLSSMGEIRFWIKTDVESGFSLQILSGSNSVSVFRFTTVGSKGIWKQISAPVSAFEQPQWAKAGANLKAINFIQLTAFQSGPYDGKYIILDHVVSSNRKALARPGVNKPDNDGEEFPPTSRAAKLRERTARLREPIILKQGDPVDMFDGKTLAGWFATPRIYVPKDARFVGMPADRLYDEVVKFYEVSDAQIHGVPNRERVKNKGVWKVEDGVVVGGQMPDSIVGAYLMSEKTYGDFELTLEANPDYPIDTGIMVRAHKLGSVGYQVLVDNRPNGTIGGVYGNSVGNFFAYPFVFDADEEPGNKIANIREGDPNALKFRGGQFKTDYAATLDEFKEVWKPNDWNEIKIRCTGRLPLIETWINGIPIAKIDTATLGDVVPDYDAEAIFDRIGRVGHIGLEVHDSPKRDRWAPGAECRWRNVRIQELEVDEKKPQNISLSKIDGRHWLVDSDGKPFFAHGITHVGNARSKHAFMDISTACRKLGFNAYGYGCPQELQSDMPYLDGWNHLVPISMYRGNGSHKFPDIFDPKEQARIDAGVKANCARSKDNPNCIGYCWTDLATWPLENREKRNWVDFIRRLPENAPGQRAYQEFLSTWDGDDGNARDQAFLKLIAREYFRVIGEANKKYDPDHLIFGDRLSFYTYDADVLKEMLPWVDAIAFQPHFWGPFPKKELDEIHELSGKPILLCDFAVRFKDGDKDVTNWRLYEDSVAAGEAYAEYVKAAIDTQYILGVFWCNPIDSSKGFGKAGVKQGFFGNGLTERPGLHEAVRKLNAYRVEVTPEAGKK